MQELVFVFRVIAFFGVFFCGYLYATTESTLPLIAVGLFFVSETCKNIIEYHNAS